MTSDVDPDPQNLMDPDADTVRIQVKKITKLISKHVAYKKECWLDPAFPFILCLGIRIHGPK